MRLKVDLEQFANLKKRRFDSKLVRLKVEEAAGEFDNFEKSFDSKLVRLKEK